MKRLLIKWLLPYVIDMIIKAMVVLVNRSSNDIDDQMVDVLIASRDKIEEQIRLELL